MHGKELPSAGRRLFGAPAADVDPRAYIPVTDALLTGTGGDLAAVQAANLDVHTKLLALLARQ